MVEIVVALITAGGAILGTYVAKKVRANEAETRLLREENAAQHLDNKETFIAALSDLQNTVLGGHVSIHKRFDRVEERQDAFDARLMSLESTPTKVDARVELTVPDDHAA